MKIKVLAAGCKTGCESCSKTIRVIEKVRKRIKVLNLM